MQTVVHQDRPGGRTGRGRRVVWVREMEGSRSKRNGGRCPLGDSQQEDHGYCNCPFPMLYEPAHVISRCLAFWFLVYSQSALGGGGGCGGTGVARNCVFLCIVKLLAVVVRRAEYSGVTCSGKVSS